MKLSIFSMVLLTNGLLAVNGFRIVTNLLVRRRRQSSNVHNCAKMTAEDLMAKLVQQKTDTGAPNCHSDPNCNPKLLTKH
jgi:hypothetical protein